jgi:hypothetical protein
VRWSSRRRRPGKGCLDPWQRASQCVSLWSREAREQRAQPLAQQRLRRGQDVFAARSQGKRVTAAILG